MAKITHKFKKGDTVQVLSGSERGKQGKIKRLFPVSQRATVEGLFISSRHQRPKRSGEKGEIVKVSLPVSLSKLQVVCPRCGKPTRVGFMVEQGKKQRCCKKCHSPLA